MARDFRQLLCSQLSHELKCEVLAGTATQPASTDYRFCDQIRDSAAGAPRNIADLVDPLCSRLTNLAGAALRTTTTLMLAKQRQAAAARSVKPRAR